MRHKLRRNALLGVVVPFIAVLTAFTDQSALTQVQAARKPVWQSQVWPARIGIGRIGSTDAFRAQTARNGVRAMLPASLYSFLDPTYYSDGGSLALSVVAADLNGDGKPDLVVADCGAGGNYNDCGTEGNGSISVLLGRGDGTFGTAVTYDSGGYIATSVAVADVNGDGKPDVIVANYCFDNSSCPFQPFQRYGTVGVLLGNGDGTLQPAHLQAGSIHRRCSYNRGAYSRRGCEWRWCARRADRGK